MGRLFGTDGVRGIANEKLTIDLAMRLGSAAAAVISGNSRRRPVFVVGMDSRMSSDMLAMACAAGLCSVGADVIMLGLVPTPAVAYLGGKYKADAGIISRVSDFAPSTGVIIETPGFLPHETGLQNLMLLAAMSGRADRLRVRRAMIELGLDPDEKKPVWKYSLGQRQRLGFAQAFMEDPDVLILDEPFNAMDKASMEEVHDLLQRFKAQDKTVLLASDVIYEMEDGGLHLVKQ